MDTKRTYRRPQPRRTPRAGPASAAMSRLPRGRPAPRETSLRERILAQCVASAFILAALLALRLIKIPIFQDWRAVIKNALASEGGLEVVTESLGELQNGFAAFKRDAGSVFGLESEATEAYAPDATPGAAAVTSDDFGEVLRIDEDILNEMNSRRNTYGKTEKEPLTP